MMRVASWPHWYHGNPYLNLFYAALEEYGIEHLRDLPLDRDLFKGESRPDAFHIHWPEDIWRAKSGGAPVQLRRILRLLRFVRSARRRSVRILWTVHNLEHHSGATWIDGLGYRALNWNSDLRIFHGVAARDAAFRRYGSGRGKTLVMPCGNYDGVFPPAAPRGETRRSLGIDRSSRLILCFGGLRSYRGFDNAMRSMSELGPAYELVVAGPIMELEPEVHDELAAIASGYDNIKLIPEYLSDQYLADLAAAADVVMAPHRRATTSGSLLAALTLGRGVVVTEQEAFHEILDDFPLAGVFANGSTPHDLAGAVREFFAVSPEERGKSARLAADRYPWREMVRPLARWLQDEDSNGLDPAPDRAQPPASRGYSGRRGT